MGKLILFLVVALVVAGMFMAVDAGHGDGNAISRSAGCMTSIDAGNPFAAQLEQAGNCVVGSVQ